MTMTPPPEQPHGTPQTKTQRAAATPHTHAPPAAAPRQWISAPPVVQAPRRWPLAVGMLALGYFLGMATLLIGAAVASAIGSSPVTGSLTLVGGAGSSCVGFGGYSDIAKGTAVTVRDASGTVVGTGHLEAGKYDGDLSCVYPFAVGDVPSSDFYTVEVSHRGQVTFDRKAVEGGQVSLTLGT
jgi:hypothetical protein